MISAMLDSFPADRLVEKIRSVFPSVMSIYLGETDEKALERLVPLYLYPAPSSEPLENARIQAVLLTTLSEAFSCAFDCLFFSLDHTITIAILQRRGNLLWGKNILPTEPIILDFEWIHQQGTSLSPK